MHDVPRESVGEHLGFGESEDDGRDVLDERLARMSPPICMNWLHAYRTPFWQNTRDMFTTFNVPNPSQMIPSPPAWTLISRHILNGTKQDGTHIAHARDA
jgi:hypothetical protein